MDFYAFIILYILFHLKKWYDRPKDKTAKSNSPYYVADENGEYKFDKTKMFVPLRRALITTLGQTFVILTFSFASKGGLN